MLEVIGAEIKIHVYRQWIWIWIVYLLAHKRQIFFIFAPEDSSPSIFLSILLGATEEVH